jgi:hypothetical protein
VYHIRDALKSTAESRASVFRNDDDFRSARLINVAFSIAKLAQRRGSSKWIILNAVQCEPHNGLKLLAYNIRSLARTLAQADLILFGLLIRKSAAKAFIEGRIKS